MQPVCISVCAGYTFFILGGEGLHMECKQRGDILAD